MILRILFILAKGYSPFPLPPVSVVRNSRRGLPRVSRGGDEIIDKLYLMSTDQEPHGLQFHNDGISFDPPGAGKCELCDNLSANCLFFLVFQSAPGGLRFTGYLTFLERSGLSCYPVKGLPSPRTIGYGSCERVYLALDANSPRPLLPHPCYRIIPSRRSEFNAIGGQHCKIRVGACTQRRTLPSQYKKTHQSRGCVPSLRRVPGSVATAHLSLKDTTPPHVCLCTKRGGASIFLSELPRRRRAIPPVPFVRRRRQHPRRRISPTMYAA